MIAISVTQALLAVGEASIIKKIIICSFRDHTQVKCRGTQSNSTNVGRKITCVNGFFPIFFISVFVNSF